MMNLSQTLEGIKNTNEEKWGNIKQEIRNLDSSLDKKLDSRFGEFTKTLDKKIDDKLGEQKPVLIEQITQAVESTVTTKIDKLSTKHEVDMKALEGRIKDEIIAQMKEEIKESKGDMHPREQHSPGTQINNTVKEMTDRDRRKKNFIVHGLPEAENKGKEKIEERKKKDKEEIERIIREKLGIQDPCVIDVLRLGKVKPNVPRPLKIVLRGYDKKQEIFKNLGKLKGTDHKSLAFRDDMTALEREHQNRLVKEAQEREKKDESGRWIYRVRGPPWDKKIVKIDRNEKAEGMEVTKGGETSKGGEEGIKS